MHRAAQHKFAWMYCASDAVSLWSRHFTKLCKFMYPCEGVSEIQPINEHRHREVLLCAKWTCAGFWLSADASCYALIWPHPFAAGSAYNQSAFRQSRISSQVNHDACQLHWGVAVKLHTPAPTMIMICVSNMPIEQWCIESTVANQHDLLPQDFC